jgi:large subunit ribosomal protein L30
VAEQKTIRIKWVRSGIGFSYQQKRAVRSLGLRRLNQVVERPDTPAIRGLVGSVPHLVTIVEAPAEPGQRSIPEYTIKPAARSAETAVVETETAPTLDQATPAVTETGTAESETTASPDSAGPATEEPSRPQDQG